MGMEDNQNDGVRIIKTKTDKSSCREGGDFNFQLKGLHHSDPIILILYSKPQSRWNTSRKVPHWGELSAFTSINGAM